MTKKNKKHSKKSKDMICSYEPCSKKIDKKDKYTTLATHNPDGEDHYHFDCWNKYFQQCIENKINVIKDQVVSLFNNPLIKGVLGKITGLDKIFSGFKQDSEEKSGR